MVVDRSNPVATVVTPVVDLGSRGSPTVIRVRVGGRTSDTGSGVATSTLQAAMGAADFRTAATRSGTTVAATLAVTVGRGFAARVRGTDRLGHTGAWAATSGLHAVLYSDGGSLIRYVGWSRTAGTDALGHSVHRTTRGGATAVIRVTGRGFALVAPMGPAMGRMAVTIDGHAAGVIDLRRAGSLSRVAVFARSWSRFGTHTVVLRALGTAGRPTVALDGLVVLR